MATGATSAENALPMDNIYEKFRELIVSDMADTIKAVSQIGRWDEPPTEISEDMLIDKWDGRLPEVVAGDGSTSLMIPAE